jgi:hypothetical protein
VYANSPGTSFSATVRQPPFAVGYTQASIVIPVVRSSVAASATVTRSLTPSNESAFPKRPADVQVDPLIEPALLLPDASPTVGPVPSSKPYAATRPPGA